MTAVCETGVCVLTCWGSESAPAPPLRWHQGWFEPQYRCRGWCNTLLAPLTRQKTQTQWVTIREEHRGVIESREFTNLSDHPLEDVAAADSLENLGWDSLRDAVQTFLHEGFTLERNTQTQVRQTDRQVDRWMVWWTDRLLIPPLCWRSQQCGGRVHRFHASRRCRRSSFPDRRRTRSPRQRLRSNIWPHQLQIDAHLVRDSSRFIFSLGIDLLIIFSINWLIDCDTFNKQQSKSRNH